jgi:DNA polymerase III sliding clamp (beta) subunit (PCNA family)
MDTFPKLPELVGEPEKVSLNADTLLKMHPFTSDDPFRIVMQDIYFDKDQMAATNAHKLAWLPYPKNQSVKTTFILRKEAIKILPKNTEVDIISFDGYVRIEFMFAGCRVEVISPKVDGKFVDYKAVIPSTDDAVCSALVSKSDFQWDKLSHAANKASISTFSIEGSTVKIRVEDIDRNTEFEQEFKTNVEWRQPNKSKHISGMNIKLLKECLEFYSGPVKIYSQPNGRPNNIGDNIILCQCLINE